MNRREKVKNKDIDRKKSSMKNIIVVLFVFIGIVVAVLHSSYVNAVEVEKNMEQNLADVARQNAAVLDSKIYSQYELLNSLSRELKGVTTDNIGDKLNHFNRFMDNFKLRRFAFCFPGGMTYSTDGEPANLYYRDFYSRGMKGKCCITGILTDALRGDYSQVNVMTIPVYDDEGDVSGVFGLAYDTKIFNESLQIDSFGGKGYSCIVNESGEIMAITGDNGFKLSENIIDYLTEKDERNVSIVKRLQEQMNQKMEGSGEIYLSQKSYYYSVPVDLMDGSITWHIITIIPSEVLNDRVSAIQKNTYVTSFIVVILVAISAFIVIMFVKDHHKRMLKDAYEDPVTHGENYAKFGIEMANRNERTGCLVAMDLANFSNISIVAGELASDVMIRETWNIISSSLNKDELAGHVRDDKFVLFLLGDDDKLLERMHEISESILEKVRDYHVYGIQTRYGIYHMSETETLENAYSKVKIALEEVVANHGTGYAFYNEVNRARVQYEKQLEERFPTALEKEEFEVWYQPKYSASDCSIVGSEALVRWRKENGEMISPGEFIPLFEGNGMIARLDEYMFRMVCRQQKKWMDEGKVMYPVSINISRASLYCADVEKRYSGIMKEYNIEPQYIQLEVTETVMEKKTDICRLLNKFRQMGVKILMDDFGTGYSSLATLNSQCFDTLKLDKTLIDHIGDRDGETMLYHIIRMGQQMGLHITAEGVERKTQLEFLQNLKCDDIQGFYFSKPIPLEEYEAMINGSAL